MSFLEMDSLRKTDPGLTGVAAGRPWRLAAAVLVMGAAAVLTPPCPRAAWAGGAPGCAPAATCATSWVDCVVTEAPCRSISPSYATRACDAGIMPECGPSYFCPSELVTREDMAVHLLRATLGSSYGPPGVSTVDPWKLRDVDRSHCLAPWIWDLLDRQITTGCVAAGGLVDYCPLDTVPRKQMAIFIARIKAGGDDQVLAAYTDPGTGRSYDCDTASPRLHFTDVAAGVSWCRHAHYLWAIGAVDGCASDPPRYCGNEKIGRIQMAKILCRVFVAGCP